MNKSRIFLSFGLMASIGLGLISPATATPFDANCDLSGTGSSADPFLLGSEGDLIDMDECSVNSGTIHFALSRDIYVSSGFGNYYRDAYFNNGVDVSLDGRGMGIYGLRFGDPLELEVGFFGDVDDLTVRNITLQTGAIVGGNETSVLVGEANNLVVENVTIINDSLTCESECGLLAGRVAESANVDQVTVVSNSFVGGDESGLLIGALDHHPESSSSFTNINATGSMLYTSEGGQLGGLIGRIYSGTSVAFSNIYVMALARETDALSGPNHAGGLVGEFETDGDQSTPATLSITGVFAEFEFEGVTNFGGMVGSIYHNDINNTDPELNIVMENVMARGTVYYSPSQSGMAGGLIGSFSPEANTNLTIDDALVAVSHVEMTGDTSGISLVSIVETDTADLGSALASVSLTDIVLDDEYWGNRTMDTTSLNQEAGITSLSTAQIDVAANLPFDSIAAHPGTLGTDDWEICDTTGGPFPTFTPNACGQPTITLSGNQVSAELTEAVTSITDQDAKGPGTSLFYSVEPSLPRGLNLNPITGTISGSPIELRAAGTYRIIKYNALTNPLKNSNLFAVRGERIESDAVSLFVAEALLPTLAAAQPSESESSEVQAARAYAGPILVQFSERMLTEGQPSIIDVRGDRLNLVTGISIDGLEVSLTLNSDSSIQLAVPALTSGEKTIVVRSSEGVLNHQGALVVSPSESIVSEQSVEAPKVVNAGSFKGFVAIYAKGHEGKRLSAKVGKDWVIVPSLASDFERIVEFTVPGVAVSVKIYIDRVLTETVNLITK